jgi:cell division protein FtsL
VKRNALQATTTKRTTTKNNKKTITKQNENKLTRNRIRLLHFFLVGHHHVVVLVLLLLGLLLLLDLVLREVENKVYFQNNHLDEVQREVKDKIPKPREYRCWKSRGVLWVLAKFF